jgi:hypothetical protein
MAAVVPESVSLSFGQLIVTARHQVVSAPDVAAFRISLFGATLTWTRVCPHADGELAEVRASLPSFNLRANRSWIWSS